MDLTLQISGIITRAMGFVEPLDGLLRHCVQHQEVGKFQKLIFHWTSFYWNRYIVVLEWVCDGLMKYFFLPRVLNDGELSVYVP